MLQDEIQQVIANAIAAAQADESLVAFDLPTIEIMRPKQADHGDYSTNIALVTAAEIKKQTGAKSNPRQIAQAIVEHIQTSQNGEPGLIESVDLAGPGFINLRLSHGYLTEQVRQINALGDGFGRSTVGGGRKAMVEYISANPTGPLTVGHGRNAVLGDTFANLLDWIGYDVTREYYFNNAGRQMRVLGQSVRARYEELLADPEVTSALPLNEEQSALLKRHLASYTTKEIDGGDGQIMEAPASFPADGYQGEYIYDIAQSLIDEEGVGLLASDDVYPFQLAAERAIFADIDRTIQRLGIKMDVYFNEHSLYENEAVWEVLNELRERGHVFDADGAVWFRTTALGDSQDKVLVKSSGEPTYRLPDMAYHVNKLERGFERIIDVFGADHIAEFPDVARAIEALGYDSAKIEVVIYQFVTLVRSGRPVKMSTRKANFVTLDDLISDVGEDVTRFFFLMRSPTSHLEFDLDLAKETSEKNPVFYLQYAHARVCSILRRAVEEGVTFANQADLHLLHHSSEVALMKELVRLPEVILYTAQIKEPQTLVTYLNDVATTFNQFYRDCHILNEEQQLATARMQLAQAARIVLANGLRVLGISAPEKM